MTVGEVLGWLAAGIVGCLIVMFIASFIFFGLDISRKLEDNAFEQIFVLITTLITSMVILIKFDAVSIFYKLFARRV